MSEVIFDLEENCNWYGRHAGFYKIIHLWTHYRAWKDNEELLIKSIVKTIAHEEIHGVLRSFDIKYSKDEEGVLRRLQVYLYPEIYYSKNHLNKEL